MFYSRQRGSALVISLFIITVMGAFAAAMIRIDWSGQDTTAREVFSIRAWYAAHSGNEIVLGKLFPLGQTTSDPQACDQTYDLDQQAGLFHAGNCRSAVKLILTRKTASLPININLESYGNLAALGSLQRPAPKKCGQRI